MTVSFRKSFLRDLKKVKDSKVRDRVREAIHAVEDAESLADVAGVKKMSGSSEYYRIRIGRFRIGLAVEGEEIEFVRVLGREDIYKHFP